MCVCVGAQFVLLVPQEQALSAVNPRLFTIATLTGHVGRCYGDAYSAILDNGPARKALIHRRLFDQGTACAFVNTSMYASSQALVLQAS
jgi:hypothetical protein